MDHIDREMRHEAYLQRAVDAAVLAADRVILAASDGSNEETDWLTGQVALKFMQKAVNPFQRGIFLKQMNDRKEKVSHGQENP